MFFLLVICCRIVTSFSKRQSSFVDQGQSIPIPVAKFHLYYKFEIMVNVVHCGVPDMFLKFMDNENFLQRLTNLSLRCRGSTFLKEFKRKIDPAPAPDYR